MRCLFGLTLVFLLGGSSIAVAEVLYNVTDLGTLDDNFSSSFVTSINNAGQMVGTSYTSSGAVSRAFLYANGQMNDLGTLGGSSSNAAAINNIGQVTGSSETSSGAVQAFLYSNGQMTSLGTPSSLFDTGGVGINDAGQVALLASGNSYGFHALLYANGQLRDLGTLGGSNSWPYAINNAGQVAGWSEIHPGSFTEHAFLYSNGQMTDLFRTLPGSNAYGEAHAINNAGQVTGWFSTSFIPNHAFLYSNGHVTDLGSVPGFFYSSGEGINSAGQVVGQLQGTDTHYGYNEAFVYSNGHMTDLNSLIDPSLGITLTDAVGIDDKGQIAADSNNRAYLLTPVPEPGMLALMGLALLGLGTWARRTLLKPRCQERSRTRNLLDARSFKGPSWTLGPAISVRLNGCIE